MSPGVVADAADLDLPVLTPGARRIAETAAELFYRNGIHAVGVDTVAARSGVTKRTLYDRFGSKDRLVRVCLQLRHQAWWPRLDHHIARASGSRVLAVFDAYTDDAVPTGRGCGFLNAAAELPADHPALGVVRAHKRAVSQRVEELIRTDHSGLEDPTGAAAHVFLLLEGAIAHQGLAGSEPMTTGRAMAQRLLGGADGG